MPRSLIGLGSNLGDRQHMLRRAVELLTADPSIRGVATSGFHETAPVGGPPGQAAFLNAAVALDTTLAPERLHQLLQRIEVELGRRPAPRWAPRTIDLDLLLYGKRVVNTAALSVPHPRMAFRRFVLAPAVEVAREMVHPLTGWTVGRQLAHLDTAAPYVALLGMPEAGKSALGQRVARTVGGSYLANPARLATTDTTADPSGRAELGPIQFLGGVAELLRGHNWHSAQPVAVSDFYFDECLAYARIGLDDSRYRHVREAWMAARETVVAPKLLVVLDTWAAGLLVRPASSINPVPAKNAQQLPPDARPNDRLRQELLSLANRDNQGPVLYAGRDDPQAQFEEITAAVAAME